MLLMRSSFRHSGTVFPVSLDAPVFTLTHTMAAKGVLGGDYTYHYTEAGFQKRFWFSAFGYTDVILKAGKVWNKVPFPLLIIPKCQLVLHHSAGVLLADECNGIYER